MTRFIKKIQNKKKNPPPSFLDQLTPLLVQNIDPTKRPDKGCRCPSPGLLCVEQILCRIQDWSDRIQSIRLGQAESFSSHLLASQFCISPFPFYIAFITSQWTLWGERLNRSWSLVTSHTECMMSSQISHIVFALPEYICKVAERSWTFLSRFMEE